MSVRYVPTLLGNPLDPAAPKKFYLIEKSVEYINRDYLIRDMVRNTSLTQMEAATGIDYLFNSIPRLLELGFTVQLGELGYFKVSIRSKGSDVIEDATPDKIKSMHLRFIPGAEMRKIVNEFAVHKFPV